MKTTTIALAAVLLSELGCGGGDATQFCTFNSDCPESGDRFCINGLCRSEECELDRDCEDDESCIEGACTLDES